MAARDAGDVWEFSVSDNGPGIAPQFQQRIFGIFQTLKARDEVEGAGIGLAIVQTVVGDRGGRVWVASEPGRRRYVLLHLAKVMSALRLAPDRA